MPVGETTGDTTLLAVAKGLAGGLVVRELLDDQRRDVVVVEGTPAGFEVEEEVFEEFDGDVLGGAFAVAFAAGVAVIARWLGEETGTACSRGSRSSGRTAARSLQTR